jgi:hypothetical protein
MNLKRHRMLGCGLDSSCSGQTPVAVFYEHGNEPRGFIEGGEFLDKLSDCQLH